MPPCLPPTIRAKAVRLLFLGWDPKDIAREVHCHYTTVYRMKENLIKHGAVYAPHLRKNGCPRKVHKAAEDALMEYLSNHNVSLQKEMVWYLWEEWGIIVDQSTISRILKRRRWSGKKAQRRSDKQDKELRLAWQTDLLSLTADQLVFIDESLFNQSTGWRYNAYAPVGDPARYQADLTRGRSWSVLPAYTIDGYICCGIKEGWFNGESFYRWIVDELLPLCNAYPAPKSVIIMDNVSVHTHPNIKEAIEARGCQIRYLPPYSPDFNPIELSFSVLKAWFRRNFDEMWPQFDRDFGAFLQYAVECSRCDRFAKKHFKHSGGSGGYIFEADQYEFEGMLMNHYEDLIGEVVE